MITVHLYPRCSTCKKATRWLGERGLAFEEHDLVAKPISKGALRDLWKRSGLPLKSFFNTSGESDRAGGFGARLPSMTESQQLDALAADGKLVKRPIADDGVTVLVGFREEAWSAFG